MNGHWEEFFGKVEKLHVTDHPHNYCMLIQQIISWSSDGEERFDSFLRLHLRKCVQGMIEAMSSSSASGCAFALVDLQQQLVKKAGWIFGWMGCTTIEEAFDQALRDYPDFHDVAKA